MPTVLRTKGYRFFFFSNEGHEPSHVHVEKGDGSAKLWLNPVEVVYSVGLNSKSVREIRELVKKHQLMFNRRWNEHFATK